LSSYGAGIVFTDCPMIGCESGGRKRHREYSEGGKQGPEEVAERPSQAFNGGRATAQFSEA